MKEKLIKFIKKYPFLYNLAKKVNRRLNRIPPKQEYHSETIYYVYFMEEKEEIELIKKHYKQIQTNKSKLLIIITNIRYQKNIHMFIRNNLDISFADLKYFEKYNKKMLLNNMILLDYKQQNQKELLKYIY